MLRDCSCGIFGSVFNGIWRGIKETDLVVQHNHRATDRRALSAKLIDDRRKRSRHGTVVGRCDRADGERRLVSTELQLVVEDTVAGILARRRFLKP